MLQELFTKPVLIFGCGNVLFGDDGFGPHLIEYLHRNAHLPDDVLAMDVGTSIRDLLFDLLLASSKPKRILIVDAVSQTGREAGEVFELDIHQIPVQKVNDFSLHQFPSVNLLQELRETAGVEIRVLAVQAKEIPDAVRPGLSQEVEEALPQAFRWLMHHIEGVS